MKKVGVLSFVVFFFGIVAKAQVNFSLSADSHSVHVDITDSRDEYSRITDITTSEDQLSLSWKVVDAQIPDEWSYVVCDNFNCYIDEDLQDPTVLRKSADISAETPGFIKGAVYPHGQAGIGSFKVVLMQDADSTLSDTITFIFDASSSTVGPVFSSMRLYPNPVGSTLHLILQNTAYTVSELSIYNMVGQKQKFIEAYNLSAPTSIDLTDLDAGSYLLEVITANGERISQYFVKRSLY